MRWFSFDDTPQQGLPTAQEIEAHKEQSMKRRCPDCHREVPAKLDKGKLYLTRHASGNRNCAGSSKKVSSYR